MTDPAAPLPTPAPAAAPRLSVVPGPDPEATPASQGTAAPLWRRLTIAMADSHRAAVPF